MEAAGSESVQFFTLKLLFLVRYELVLAHLVVRLFGWGKLALFLVGLPTVPLTRQNTYAFEIMGTSRMNSGSEAYTWRHANPRFIDEIIIREAYTLGGKLEIQPSWTVVDVGANIGTFAIFSAKRASGGKVYAIEPEFKNYHRLVENIRENDLRNVVPIRVAIAGKSGTVAIRRAQSGTNTIAPESTSRFYDVCEAFKLEELMNYLGVRQIDLLKIDIEGTEFQVFGSPKFLDNVQYLSMEVHPAKGNLPELIGRIEEKGFLCKISPSYDSDAVYLFAQRDPRSR